MTRLILAASCLALTLGACASTDTTPDYDYVAETQTVTTTRGETLSDAQQVGVNDADRFASSGSAMSGLDDKFKVDCNDDDGFRATGCETETTTTQVTTVTAVPTKSVLQLIAESPDHERLANAILAADLDDDLAELENFTIFAPTDAAFASAALTGLSDDQDLEMLLRNHVIDGRYLALDVMEVIPASGNYSIPTLGDRTVDVYRSGESFKILGAGGYLVPVLSADMIGTDGVIHVIDRVLVPDFDQPDIDPS